jgi:hypothetical protein
LALNTIDQPFLVKLNSIVSFFTQNHKLSLYGSHSTKTRWKSAT